MGITKILAILKLVGDWINRYLVRQEHREAQESHDALDKNPNQWFDDHFAGSGSDGKRVQPATNRTDTEAHKTYVDNRPGNSVSRADTTTGK